MARDLTKTIAVSGSLAQDRIMVFPGKFSDHILPGKAHILNISFATDALKESWGGTAGNIAFNLSLLGEDPALLGVAGEDFTEYRNWLRKNKLDTSFIKTIKGTRTAAAHMITDKADNQVIAYYSGPRDDNYPGVVYKLKSVKIAIVAPEDKQRMIAYTRAYKKLKIPYIFDPGQQISSFTGPELGKAIKGSLALVGNDYEISVIREKTGLSLKELEDLTENLIITRGSQGSIIYTKGKKINIKASSVKSALDPTGAGDAYRAGLIYGLSRNWGRKETGQLASLLAAYAVEKKGTQNHRFSLKDFKKRYKDNYGHPLNLLGPMRGAGEK